jgi:alpha-tubulin suppressor-like RCC1 family protein
MITRPSFLPVAALSFTQQPVGSRLALAGLLIGGLMIWACGGEESTGPGGQQQPPSVASVAVTPSIATLVSVGETVQLTAGAQDASGDTLSGKTFTWSSSDASIATVSSSGLVTAVGNGSATITATTAGLSGSASLTVSQVPVAVAVTPGAAALTALGATVQFTAVAKDANDNTISGQTFTWTSSATGVATISASGMATAGGNGTATITATTAGVSGSVSLTVSQVPVTVDVTPGAAALTTIGDTVRFGAVAKDARGYAITGQTFTWGSSMEGVATVDTTGLVTARGLGRTTITASAGAVSGDAVLGVQSSIAALSAGPLLTCGVTTAGVAYCWGDNSSGGLGDGTNTNSSTPVAVVGGLSFASVSAGGSHTCGVTTGGVAYCWGDNSSGELGDGTTADRLTPVAVVGGLSFAAVSAGGPHSCGLTTAGVAYCWGRNNYGFLGDGTNMDSSTPVAVVGGLSFAALTVGSGHTCGLTTAGVAYCWGRNYAGELGNGTYRDSSTTPVAVAGGLSFAALSGGVSHTCGVTTGGVGYCWGLNYWGQLGDGTTTDRTTPVAVAGGLSFAALSAGWGTTCGVTTAGVAYCWGDNSSGGLGNGGTSDRLTPTAVVGGLSFASVSAGGSHTCGVTTGAVGYCWGLNREGQLGGATSETCAGLPCSTTPVLVLLQ